MWEDPSSICARILSAFTQNVKRWWLVSIFCSLRQLVTSNFANTQLKWQKHRVWLNHAIHHSVPLLEQRTWREEMPNSCYWAFSGIHSHSSSWKAALHWPGFQALSDFPAAGHTSGYSWFSWPGPFLTGLIYIKCMFLNTEMSLCLTASECHFISAYTGKIVHLKRWAEILLWFCRRKYKSFLRAQ